MGELTATDEAKLDASSFSDRELIEETYIMLRELTERLAPLFEMVDSLADNPMLAAFMPPMNGGGK